MAERLQHERFMRLALEQADAAAAHGDVPVGAVVVDGSGALLGSGHNRREQRCDPTAHAEIEALRDAAERLGRWRLAGLRLYVTLEPCIMCAGALVHARIDSLVYGSRDPRAGAVDSLFVVGRDPRLNHRFEIVGGVLAAGCADRLRDFFAARR